MNDEGDINCHSLFLGKFIDGSSASRNRKLQPSASMNFSFELVSSHMVALPFKDTGRVTKVVEIGRNAAL
jgi:hypothetical protein